MSQKFKLPQNTSTDVLEPGRERAAAPTTPRGPESSADAWADETDEDAESLKLGKGLSDGSESDMDMTPMVDVTFLLLIFFMVTAAFSLQKSIEIPAPKDNSPSTRAVPEEQEEDPSSVTVQVDEFNTFHVLTPESEWECPSEQELLMRLREASREATKMLVKANAEAELQYVVMALDAGTEVGMEQVQLMTVEEDD